MFSTYYTQKYLAVQDRNLGILYYSLIFFVFCWSLFSIFSQQGYLEHETVSSILSARVQRGDPKIQLSDFPYCSASEPSLLPSTGAETKKPQCILVDHFDVQYPPLEDKALTLTVSMTEAPQVRQCPLEGPACKKRLFQGKQQLWKSYYPVGVEDFTIFVKHQAMAPKFFRQNRKFSQGPRSMTGYLEDPNGQVLKVLNQSTQEDRFTLKELLLAAGGGLSLDQKIDFPPTWYLSENDTLRDSGLALIVTLAYEHHISLFSSNDHDAFSYHYRVERIPDIGYSSQEILQNNSNSLNNTERVIRTRNGVHFTFIQTGHFSRFSFTTLLITLVTSLGLLSISTLIVDTLAEYILPIRKKFSQHRYEVASLEEKNHSKEN